MSVEDVLMVLQQPVLWFAVMLVVVIVLVWYLRQAKQRFFDIQTKLYGAYEGLEESVIIFNCQQRIEHINAAAEKLLYVKARRVRGRKLDEVFDLIDEKNEKSLLELMQCHSLDKSLRTEAVLALSEDNDLPVRFTLVPLKTATQQIESLALTMIDLSENQALRQKMEHQSLHDSLTGLLNRRAFDSKLKVALNEARDYRIEHVFCYLDLDQFKLINDTSGHYAGDALIKQLAKILQDCIRSKDILARLGGDEFAILFRECNQDMALPSAEKILKLIEAYTFKWNDKLFNITASMAIVPITHGSGNLVNLMSAADATCFVAKNKGRNRIHVYHPDDLAVQKQWGDMEWVSRIKTAFSEGRFRLFAQPIQPLNLRSTDSIYRHYEVLIRLFDIKGQAVPPEHFLPAAERYALMTRLDRWVVHNVLKMMKKAQNQESLPVFSINLSGQSLDEPEFLKFVMQEIHNSGVLPHKLCFEITETTAVSNLEWARKFIQTLAKEGCTFSLDDFGTGMSSYEYLRELPVNYLKIDGSFVKDIVRDNRMYAMVRSMSHVGHTMGMETIAEYVESKEIMERLNRIGVDYGQGYGIAKPLPLSSVMRNYVL